MQIFGPDFLFGQGFFISVPIGIALGILLGVKYKLPRSWAGYAIVLVLNVLAPIIGTHTWILGIVPMDLYVVLNYVLTGLFTTLNLTFLWRLLKPQKQVVET